MIVSMVAVCVLSAGCAEIGSDTPTPPPARYKSFHACNAALASLHPKLPKGVEWRCGAGITLPGPLPGWAASRSA